MLSTETPGGSVLFAALQVARNKLNPTLSLGRQGPDKNGGGFFIPTGHFKAGGGLRNAVGMSGLFHI